MLYCSFIELDALLSIIMIIIYGLLSLKSTQINLMDVFLFCRIFPLIFVFGFYIDLDLNGLYFWGQTRSVSEGNGYASSLLNEMSPALTFGSSVVPTVNQPLNSCGPVSVAAQLCGVSIDFWLALLLFFIMYNFQSFESILLLLFAFIGQYYMLHSIDLLTFYIALEAQNFCFLVLCGLPLPFFSVDSVSSPSAPTERRGGRNRVRGGRNSLAYVFSVEASIKYFLLSAFSSGVLLFWFSAIYLQTGMSIFSFSPKEQSLYTGYEMSTISIFLILCAMMFKLGAAPLHLWVVQIYNGVKRNLLLYISTAPKLSLFGFWVNSFQTVWTDYSVVLFSIFSIILGAFGAYNQPSLRTLLAYSTINEIGLLLSALETAGFNSLFQHLGIYIISQLLLWNLYDKRIFVILAVSLAGLPPLAGFFGKSWIFWHIGTVGLTSVLLVALLCTAVSLVYYLRIIRLFWNPDVISNSLFNYDIINRTFTARAVSAYKVDLNVNQFAIMGQGNRVYLTSACVILLFILPIFVIKPFIA